MFDRAEDNAPEIRTTINMPFKNASTHCKDDGNDCPNIVPVYMKWYTTKGGVLSQQGIMTANAAAKIDIEDIAQLTEDSQVDLGEGAELIPNL